MAHGVTMGLGGSLCMAEELLKPPEYRWIIVDLPARLPKCRAQKAPLILGQGGRFAEGSGKRRKIWPRGRFGLIFGAKPI